MQCVTDKILDYVGKFMDVAVVNSSDYEEQMMVAEPKEKYVKERK